MKPCISNRDRRDATRRGSFRTVYVLCLLWSRSVLSLATTAGRWPPAICLRLRQVVSGFCLQLVVDLFRQEVCEFALILDGLLDTKLPKIARKPLISNALRMADISSARGPPKFVNPDKTTTCDVLTGPDETGPKCPASGGVRPVESAPEGEPWNRFPGS